MYKFLDNKGKLGKIVKGCTITWYPDSSAITISCHPENIDPYVFRWDGDNKRLAPFIRDGSDFTSFAMILAEVHGLTIKIIRKDDDSPTQASFI